jgi:hypothetical protein
MARMTEDQAKPVAQSWKSRRTRYSVGGGPEEYTRAVNQQGVRDPLRVYWFNWPPCPIALPGDIRCSQSPLRGPDHANVLLL